MKKLLLIAFVGLTAGPAIAQTPITITAGDMPVNGDKLSYSIATPPASLNLNDTGANKTWDFSALTSIGQAVDTYKTAILAGYVGGGIALNAFGYKVLDSLGFPGAPVTAKNIYTFFNTKSGPSRFVAEGFGANVSGFPVPAGYSNEDTIYLLPLAYGNTKTSTFKLTASLSGIGSLKQQGTRMTKVDAWGMIKTPYFTTPVPVIRVRSEVIEDDTVTITIGGTTVFPVPRHYVDYKWLANGDQYPALYIQTTVTGSTETPTTANYRDVPAGTGTGATPSPYTSLEVYPNPANSGVTVKTPSSWKHYNLRLYDATGKQLIKVSDTPHLSTADLPSGRYIIIADSGSETGIVQFVK